MRGRGTLRVANTAVLESNRYCNLRSMKKYGMRPHETSEGCCASDSFVFSLRVDKQQCTCRDAASLLISHAHEITPVAGNNCTGNACCNYRCFLFALRK